MEISLRLSNIRFSDIVTLKLKNMHVSVKEGGIHEKIAATQDMEDMLVNLSGTRLMFTS